MRTSSTSCSRAVCDCFDGAGKTTFAREFLPQEAHCPDFINADLIAAGLSPFDPEAAALRAGRLMLEEIAARVAAGRGFAFETTLSGRAYARQIPDWRRLGYHVKLIFLSLPNAEMAVARVSARVAQGGHSIQDDVVRRRFDAGLRHFHGLYQTLGQRLGAVRQFRQRAVDDRRERQPMTSPSRLRDPDLLQAGVALQRAALKAQQLSRQTGTPCYVWRDGRIVNIGAPAGRPPKATVAG